MAPWLVVAVLLGLERLSRARDNGPLVRETEPYEAGLFVFEYPGWGKAYLGDLMAGNFSLAFPIVEGTGRGRVLAFSLDDTKTVLAAPHKHLVPTEVVGEAETFSYGDPVDELVRIVLQERVSPLTPFETGAMERYADAWHDLWVHSLRGGPSVRDPWLRSEVADLLVSTPVEGGSFPTPRLRLSGFSRDQKAAIEEFREAAGVLGPDLVRRGPGMALDLKPDNCGRDPQGALRFFDPLWQPGAEAFDEEMLLVTFLPGKGP